MGGRGQLLQGQGEAQHGGHPAGHPAVAAATVRCWTTPVKLQSLFLVQLHCHGLYAFEADCDLGCSWQQVSRFDEDAVTFLSTRQVHRDAAGVYICCSGDHAKGPVEFRALFEACDSHTLSRSWFKLHATWVRTCATLSAKPG